MNWPRSKKSSAAIKSKWPGLLVEAAQAVQLKKTTSLRICSGSVMALGRRPAEKRLVVEQASEPGASVSRAARAHGLNAT